jgi:hypothetical protein
MTQYLLLLLVLFTLLACSSSPRKKSSATGMARPIVNAVPASFRGTLISHNSVRSTLGLNPLYWSNKLAHYAQQWASHQANTQNCYMKHRPHHADPFKQIYGENLFWASPKRWSDGKVELQRISISEVIKSWADEDADYNYHNNSCRIGTQCGHYTQIVWRETQAVGCAIAVCPDQSQLWVCNYNPPGNYIGERPY